MPPTNGYVIAFIDIETAPNTAYVWGKWNQNVIAFEKEWYILCFSVLWGDAKKPETYAIWDFPAYKKDPEDDRALMKKLHEVMDAADLVIAHNGDRFDIPKIRTRMVGHEIPPFSPCKSYDTLLTARRIFAFTSNALRDLAIFLKCKHYKLDVGGYINLWRGCIARDERAQRHMKKYNGMDTLVLRDVYNKIKIWDPAHPNITLAAAMEGESNRCPKCGSDEIKPCGRDYLKSYIVQRYHCKGCGAYARGKREKIPVPVLT